VSSPRFSVIIPSFDRAYLLKTRSIPSVLKQTLQDWEVIVVGDGPQNDDLRSATESFGDPRIRYVESPRPGYDSMSEEEFWCVAGAHARNYGLQLASGALIAPLDDDDEFLENHLRDAGEALDGETDFIYGCAIIRDLESGREYEDYFDWRNEATVRRFAERNVVFHSTVCYSSRLQHLRYPTTGSVPADYALWKSMLQGGAQFSSVARPQAVYYGETRSLAIRLSVPSLPPVEQYQKAVAEIFESAMLSNGGPWCLRLEQQVAETVGVPHAIAVPNGDAALVSAFRALRIVSGDRDEVIMPAYTFPSTANAAMAAGFRVAFCDVDEQSLCITPETVAPSVGGRTAAVVPVHAHGNPVDMPAMETFCRDRGLRLLSDAAPAFGARVGDRRTGSFGDMEMFSFSGTKIVSGGEGGMVCTRDPELADLVRKIGRYGLNGSYECLHVGINGKLAELPAALLVLSLPYVDGWIARRRRAAELYRETLSGLPGLRFQQASAPDAVSVWKDFPLILDRPAQRQKIADMMTRYRVDTRPYYRPLHTMPAFRDAKHDALPVTDRLADSVLCIPIYNGISDQLISYVSGIVRHAIED